ncbi:MAG: ATP-binding protein [Clostridiales bacterium]|nr:ATP-binding protein [Clostridiales bacterium]
MVNKRFAVINFFVYTTLVIIFTILHITGYNLLMDSNLFDFFHLAIETTLSMAASSIFLIVLYSFPYEKKQKYIISGSIFFSIAIVNILHIYFALKPNQWAASLTLANLTYLMVSFAIIFYNLIPEHKIATDKKHFFYVPTFFIILSYLIYLLINHHGEAIFIQGVGITPYFGVFESIILALYFYALFISFQKYFENRTDQTVNTINCLMFAILSKYVVIFHKYPNDLFVVSGHAFKGIAFLFFVKGFVMTNVQSPYKKLKEANDIKTDFLVNMSHEIRTPINIILNASRLIASNPAKYMGFISSIENNAHRLNRLSENLVIFNHIENGTLENRLSNEDIVFLIDNIIESAEDVLDKKSLDLRFDFIGKRHFIVDKEKFEQIVLNILSNSIKYSNYGGNIIIKLEINENLKLSVFNDGPPIAEEHKDKLFNKFYKVKHPGLETTEGLGIGLYIAKTFANMLNGDINIINSDELTGYELEIKAIKNPKISPRSKNVETYASYFSDII